VLLNLRGKQLLDFLYALHVLDSFEEESLAQPFIMVVVGEYLICAAKLPLEVREIGELQLQGDLDQVDFGLNEVELGLRQHDLHLLEVLLALFEFIEHD